LSVQVSNVVTARLETAAIFVEDRLASGGINSTGILTSTIGCPPFTTSRPANYYLDRFPFGEGSRGNNGYPDPDFFVSSGLGLSDTNVIFDMVTNSIIQGGEYSLYGAFADNAVTRPPPVAGGT